MVQGAGPSARYAHTLALVANRFLVALGGNDGKQTLADAWALDTSDKPYQWKRISDAGETPSPRCARHLVRATWGRPPSARPVESSCAPQDVRDRGGALGRAAAAVRRARRGRRAARRRVRARAAP